MNIRLISALCFLSLLNAVSHAQTNAAPYTVTFSAGAGRVSYSENVSLFDVDSDWDAVASILSAIIEVENNAHTSVRIEGNFFAAAEEEERWTDSTGLRQQNDLDVSGVELIPTISYRLGAGQEHRFRAYAGIGYRHQLFTRSNFIYHDDEIVRDAGRVEETFDLFYLALGTEGSQRISGRILVAGKIRAGVPFFYEVENSAFNATIDGDGGLLLTANLRMELELHDDQVLTAGVTYDHQDLEGNVESRTFFEEGESVAGLLEIPDNVLESFFFEVSWRKKWR